MKAGVKNPHKIAHFNLLVYKLVAGSTGTCQMALTSDSRTLDPRPAPSPVAAPGQCYGRAVIQGWPQCPAPSSSTLSRLTHAVAGEACAPFQAEPHSIGAENIGSRIHPLMDTWARYSFGQP